MDICLTKIQNKEIIKFNPRTSLDNPTQVDREISRIGNDISTIFYYLNSEFDIKSLKHTEENIERRKRNILAVKYISLESKEINKLTEARQTLKRPTKINYLRKIRNVVIAIGIISLFFTPRIIDGLTPVEALANKIHEKSKYKFNGSVCNDGHISHSQGRGTCSWHGGVNYSFDKGDYSKSMDECVSEAKKVSWRD